MIEFRKVINGLETIARYHEDDVASIFMPLLERLAVMQRRKNGRILVMLAAPPGAGKSTLADFLQELAAGRVEGMDKANKAGWTNKVDMPPIQVIGMDGFHRRQEFLVSHTVVRDGVEIPMVRIKGAPETFDLEHFQAAVQRVAVGETCGWPVYDRMLHNPVEDALTVDGEIVLLEGNYLLFDDVGWRDLRKWADYTIFLSADEQVLRERLIGRRMKTGVDREASEAFVDFSDMANVRACLAKRLPADLNLEVQGERIIEIRKDRTSHGIL